MSLNLNGTISPSKYRILLFSLNMNQSVTISKEWIQKQNTIISIIYKRITEELQKDTLHKNKTKKLLFTAVEIVPFEVERYLRFSPVRCSFYSTASPILSSVHSVLSPIRC